MKDKKIFGVLVGLCCILILIFAVVVALILDSRSPDPVLGIFRTEPATIDAGETELPSEDTEDTKETSAGTTEPTGDSKDPAQGTTEPTGESKDPTQGTTEPTGESKDPTQGTTEPTGESKDPTQGTTEPTGESKDPTEGTTEPTGEGKDPTEGTTEPTGESKDPTEETTDPTDPSDGEVIPPEELPPSVTIPPDEDTETGEPVGISFPCQVPGYGLVIEKMAPYSGMFVEDGTNANVQNIAMLLVHNNGDTPVEYTQICVEFEQEKLLFDISALPAGERLVVQEKTGKSIPEGIATAANALVVQRADMDMAESQVRITDNGDNTLTIQNLTQKTIPTVRVFYKYYMDEEGVFVGGIAFTVRVTRLGAGASVTIQPSHYTSQTSRVVMVLTYESEV